MKKLLRIAEVAKRVGLTLGTARNYAAAGVLPPPCERIGTVMFFDPADIAFFIEIHKGRPNARKSRRRA